MKNRVSLLVMLLLSSISLFAQSGIVNKYTVEWKQFSRNASESIPIGNGEVGANVWLEENGNLVFYMSRTDAWSENSSLYKLGRVRVSFFPALQEEGLSVRQFLNLAEGKIEMQLANSKEHIALEFLVDSESPVVYIKGTSSYPLQVTVSSEVWRTQTRLVPASERHFALQGCTDDSLLTEYADVVEDINDNLIVYHRNEHSIYPFTLKHQHLSGEGCKGDPFIHRTMGYNVSGTGFVKQSPAIIRSRIEVKEFCLKIAAYAEQTKTAQEWIDRTERIIGQALRFDEAAERTAAWWKRYWDKSYIVVQTPDGEKGDKITQAYILQSWMAACAGRGNYPIKFNGSIFTVDPVFTDSSRNYSPDFRLWGPDYWWQNTRLLYHPMLKSGDFEMMRVLFRHFFSNLPMMKQNAKVLFGADGAVNPETSTIFGTFVNHDYGWERTGKEVEKIENPYVRYYWSSGLEIVGLMYDYYNYTLNHAFANDTLLPMAREVLKFYTSFFPRDKQGKIQVTPTHSLEMYWDNVKNDLPNVAGLHYVVKGLLSLPDDCGTKEDRKNWKKLFSSLPDLPVREVDGRILYSPAEEYDATKKNNQENPELYMIFPFALCNISTPDCPIGIRTYENRIIRNTVGWTQDGQQAARLGLVEEAAANLWAKVGNSNPNHRFPAYWGPNFDWTPDQKHGGNLLLTLQEMVVQVYGGTVYLLPAFPKDWEVSFKLHIPGCNTVTGEYKERKWVCKPSLQNRRGLKIKTEW